MSDWFESETYRERKAEWDRQKAELEGNYAEARELFARVKASPALLGKPEIRQRFNELMQYFGGGFREFAKACGEAE